jgi:hypothetical protein
MKYTPLNNQPNISLSRLESISPSLKMDSNGYPHVSWLDVGNNINNVNYTYWNGISWSFYDIPKIYISNESIIFSPNALVLDSLNSPLITFARKSGSGSRLSFASYNTEWVFSDLDVTYDVGWIGLIRYDGHIDPDFSSSSSLSFSSISSGISSSSSSLESKSSNSSLSSSSSSYSHVVYYVCVYDVTNELFKIYSVVNGSWDITPVSSPAATVNNFESLRIDRCGRRLGIAYVDNGSLSSSSSGSYHSGTIKYNFLDLDDFSTWSFVDFQDLNYSLSYGEIIDMDMKGYYEEDASIIAFGWVSRTSDTSYVCSVLADNNGTETPSNYVTEVVESQVINLIVPSDYIVNSYRKIALCIGGSNLIRMVASGAVSKFFQLFSGGGTRFWYLDPVDISGISDGIVPTYLGMEFSSDTKLVIAADSGDIYYFEESAGSSSSSDEYGATFPLSTPDLVLANEEWAYRADYSIGALSGADIAGTYGNIAGEILRDSERPLLITSNPVTPP